jgi:hypothetical protein
LVKEEATNKSDVIKEINDCISSAIEAEISRRNDGNFEFKFYLPYETTELGVNPISGPSALVFLNNATYASRYSIDAVNVGGYRAQQRQYIVGFTKNGVKYYCYAKQLPDSAGLTVENYFETMLEAAKAGYAPYMPYLMNDKNTKAN